MALEQFHFESSDGTKIDCPFLNDKITYKQAKKIRKDHRHDEEAIQDEFLEVGLDAKTREQVENLSLRDFQKFVEGWAESGDATLGES